MAHARGRVVGNRDAAAARVSWKRALQVADSLPADDADRLVMRIAPRTMLCGNAWRGTPVPASGMFEELRELCAEAGDKTSLAIAMTGVVAEHSRYARMRERCGWPPSRWSWSSRSGIRP